MATENKLGIWMDHSSAHLIEFTAEPAESKIMTSKFTHSEKRHALSKNENSMHQEEQHEQSSYYKSLGEIIKKYDEVVLFGPTAAKTELFNMLKKDHHFDKIKIKMENADKMTENQQHAFVKEYFSKEIIRF